MFDLFKRKVMDKKAIVTITKSSKKHKEENKLKDEALQKATVCPECGFKIETTYPMEYMDGTEIYCSECDKCGCEWDVSY